MRSIHRTKALGTDVLPYCSIRHCSTEDYKCDFSLQSQWTFHQVAPESIQQGLFHLGQQTFLTDHGWLCVVANKIICYSRLTNPFTLILINESIPGFEHVGPKMVSKSRFSLYSLPEIYIKRSYLSDQYTTNKNNWVCLSFSLNIKKHPSPM